MRKRLLRWLACPLCRGKLEVRAAVWLQQPVAPADLAVLEATAPIDPTDEIEIEVVAGALICARCRCYYPIHNGVPRLLTYPTEVARVHAREHAQWIAEQLSGYTLPASEPPPGEAGGLRNFSNEWTATREVGSGFLGSDPRP